MTRWLGVIREFGLRVACGWCRVGAEWVSHPEAVVGFSCAEGRESLYC